MGTKRAQVQVATVKVEIEVQVEYLGEFNEAWCDIRDKITNVAEIKSAVMLIPTATIDLSTF